MLQIVMDGSLVGWRLIQEIRRFLASEWEVKVRHSYCEVSSCADALATMIYDHALRLHVYEQCPARLTSFVLVITNIVSGNTSSISIFRWNNFHI